MFFLAACVGLPVVFLLVATADYEPASALLVIMILVYSGSHMTALIARGAKRPMQGVFWLFVYITMGVAALAQVTTGLSQRVADPATLPVAYGIVLTGLVAYDIGHLIAGRKQSAREGAFAERPPRTEIRVARVRWVSLLALAVSAYNVASNGLGVYFSSRQESVAALEFAAGDSEGQATRAIISALGSVPQLVALLCWIVIAAAQHRKAGKATIETKAWIFILGAVLLLTANVFSASRFWVLTIAISVFFVVPWVRSSLYRFALFGGAVAAIAVFPLSDVFRLSAEYRDIYGFQSRGIIENLAVKDYDQMVMTANGVWYTDAVGFHYGEQMLGNLLFWVPRSIWPNKPIDTGVEIGTAMAQVNVNLSSPLWIEFFIDLGIPGVIIGFALFGFLSRRADGFFEISNAGFFTSPSALQVLVPLLAGYQFILLRGPLLQSMGRLAVMLLLIWFIFARIRVQSAPAPKRRAVMMR
jgi:oligosaccharide repeat unit polymerase